MSSSPVRTFTAVAAPGLALASVAAVFLGWLSEEVLAGDTSRFDAYARGLIHAGASPSLTAIMRFFTDLGSVSVLGCLLILAISIFWIREGRRAAIVLVIAMVGSGVLDAALKLGFHRARPSAYFGITPPHSFSYPSGHALLCFVFFAMVAALWTPRVPRLWARTVIWATAVGVIGLIGLSRVYLGVHYPTDVIAGYLTAFIWVITVSLGDRLGQRKNPRGRTGSEPG